MDETEAQLAEGRGYLARSRGARGQEWVRAIGRIIAGPPRSPSPKTHPPMRDENAHHDEGAAADCPPSTWAPPSSPPSPIHLQPTTPGAHPATNLVSLNLANNDLTGPELVFLLPLLRNHLPFLSNLELHGNAGVAHTDAIAILADWLAAPLVSQDHLGSMAAGCSLRDLGLVYCGLGDAGAAELARGLASNDSLTTLSISHNGIRAAIPSASLARSIARHPRLQFLYLDYNDGFGNEVPLSALSVGLAAESCTLQALHLARCKIDDNGAEILAHRGVAKNRTLTSLWLGNNRISSRGAEQLLAALRTHSFLRVLHLPNNRAIDGKVLEDIELVSRKKVFVQPWEEPPSPATNKEGVCS